MMQSKYFIAVYTHASHGFSITAPRRTRRTLRRNTGTARDRSLSESHKPAAVEIRIRNQTRFTEVERLARVQCAATPRRNTALVRVESYGTNAQSNSMVSRCTRRGFAQGDAPTTCVMDAENRAVFPKEIVVHSRRR
jgi:hypothetical protein